MDDSSFQSDSSYDDFMEPIWKYIVFTMHAGFYETHDMIMVSMGNLVFGMHWWEVLVWPWGQMPICVIMIMTPMADCGRVA